MRLGASARIDRDGNGRLASDATALRTERRPRSDYICSGVGVLEEAAPNRLADNRTVALNLLRVLRQTRARGRSTLVVENGSAPQNPHVEQNALTGRNAPHRTRLSLREVVRREYVRNLNPRLPVAATAIAADVPRRRITRSNECPASLCLVFRQSGLETGQKLFCLRPDSVLRAVHEVSTRSTCVSGDRTRARRGDFVTDVTHESTSQIPVRPDSRPSKESSTAIEMPSRVTDWTR